MLGPMQLVDNGRTVGLGGMKQRATLGFLLLRANEVVATSHLLNVLWGVDGTPTTARKILQNAVHGLRGVLSATGTAHGPAPGPTPELLTQPPGYMMRVDPEQVDLYLFHRWAGQGRERLARGDADGASVLLSDALALWRGPVLADLVEAGIRWPELAAVRSARLDAMEDYFDAQLARGRHQAILPELEEMVRADPLRERCCGQLVLALYRCGRQADALDAYKRVRAALVENLGLEPGRGLQQLQQAILAQDPALSLAGAETYAPLTPPTYPEPVLVGPAGEPAGRFGGPVAAAEDARSGAYELDVLRGLAERARHRGVPHLVTVLGRRGTGKSGLLRDFGRSVGVRPGEQRVLGGRVSPAGAGTPLAAPRQILAAYCGIGPDTDGATARAVLARTVRRLFPPGPTSELLLSRLGRLLVADPADALPTAAFPTGEPHHARVLGAWTQFLREAAQHELLVLCVDDLHRADDPVLDAFEEIAEVPTPGALFVVAAAGPELLVRRPHWGGGKRHVTTVTLDPPERVTREQLLEPGRSQRPRTGRVPRPVVTRR
ncbi:DNA-binding transcriptional activator of the SARP family [Streptomyces sp. MnatMP-M77]|nr:AAA family ATPase [Streptomyces sp. SID8364]SBU96077.1 DNA-binding transcriptional activator of the SARP family [Streptomyces sp. MnatMP-M77]